MDHARSHTVFALIAMQALGTTAALAQPTIEVLCHIAEDTVAGGLDYIATRHEFLLLDGAGDKIDLIDSDTCTVTRSIDIASLDLAPGDIAYWAARDQIVITGTNGLAFVDYATGSLVGACEMPEVGRLQGVDVIDETGQLILIDEANSGAPLGNAYTALVVADAQCHLQRQSSLLLTGKIGRITYPSGVTYLPGTGRALLNDLTTERLYALDLEGRRSFSIDVAEANLTGLTGIAPFDAPNAFALADFSTDAIYRLEISLDAIAVAENLSGTFRSRALGAAVTLFERGEGAVTGSVSTAQQTLAFAGDFNPDQGTLAAVLISATGQAIALTGEVSDDLNRIVFPAPLGLLTRELAASQEAL